MSGQLQSYLIQKSTNTLMVHVQCITAHSLSGDVVEYYLLHNGAAAYPVSMITKVHDTVPFTQDDMREINPKDITAIPISTSVSYLRTHFLLFTLHVN